MNRQSQHLVWQGSLWQPQPPHDHPAHPGWYRIDPGLDAAATRVPSASREDSRPQAILKFHRPISFDNRACDGLPVKSESIFRIKFVWLFVRLPLPHCGLKICYVFWKVMHKTYTGHETRTKTVWETRFIQILGFPVWPKNLFKVGLSK